MRGYWWSPDGDALLVARVDDAPVQRWYIADPAHPDRAPDGGGLPRRRHRNAGVDPADHRPRRHAAPPSAGRGARRVPRRRRVGRARPARSSCSRATSGRCGVLRVDPATRGDDAVGHEQTDPAWVDIVRGVPAHTAAGALVTAADVDGARRLVVDGEPVTPAGLQVRERAGRRRRHGAVHARSERPSSIGLWTWGRRTGSPARPRRPGVRVGRLAAAAPWSSPAQTCDSDGTGTTILPRRGSSAGDGVPRRSRPGSVPRVTLLAAGARRAVDGGAAARRARAGHRRLPVLMDPYGGPHAQRVLAARGRVPDQPVVRRPGLRRRRRRRPGHPGARARSSSGPCAATSPAPVLDDQVDGAARGGRAGTPTSTWTGSASAAGRSAGTSPRWPCSAGPTSSTRRWRARR